MLGNECADAQLYAEKAWQPDDITAAWNELDLAATRNGYPSVPLYDGYGADDPYDAVRMVRDVEAPLERFHVQQ